MIPRKQLFSGIYILCYCGCKGYVKLVNKKGRFRQFISGHNFLNIDQTGENNNNWRGGKYKSRGYWRIHIPNYYRSYKTGHLPEHIYIYETHHKCCILPWGEIHHIDGNKENNEISNLQCLLGSKHASITHKGKRYRLGKHKDTSNRRCFKCGSNKTILKKHKGKYKTPYPFWLHLPWDKINWYCRNCYVWEMKNNIKV